MVGLLTPSAIGSVQLEGPESVGDILEIGANCENFVNHIFNTNHAMTTQVGLDQVVGGDWCPFTVNLEESTFVDQLTDWFQVGTSPSDVGFWKKRAKHEFQEFSTMKIVKWQNWGNLKRFTITQIQREINLGILEVPKLLFRAILGALNFVIWMCTFQPSKYIEMVALETLRSSNLNSRKISVMKNFCNFHTVGLLKIPVTFSI